MTRRLALSIRQPWAWAILHHGKRIENRSWCLNYEGPIHIHAAKGCTRSEYIDAMAWMVMMGLVPLAAAERARLETLDRGGLVGRARVVDVIGRDGRNAQQIAKEYGVDLRWWTPGQYGIVLADVQAIQFVPLRGALGLFELPEGAP